MRYSSTVTIPFKNISLTALSPTSFLHKKLDYIIRDTPPYGLVTATTLLAAHADISVVALRQGFTFNWVLQELNKKLSDNPSQPLYTVLNGVGEKKQYGSFKKYGYGYTEYFDVPEKRKRESKRIQRGLSLTE